MQRFGFGLGWGLEEERANGAKSQEAKRMLTGFGREGKVFCPFDYAQRGQEAEGRRRRGWWSCGCWIVRNGGGRWWPSAEGEGRGGKGEQETGVEWCYVTGGLEGWRRAEFHRRGLG